MRFADAFSKGTYQKLLKISGLGNKISGCFGEAWCCWGRLEGI